MNTASPYSQRNINWKDIFENVDWKEFKFDNETFRAAKYVLDGGTFVAVHKFVGSDVCPDGNGWAGQSWCKAKNINGNWPSSDIVKSCFEETEVVVENSNHPIPIASGKIPLPTKGEIRY